jgi:hypothetical protein
MPTRVQQRINRALAELLGLHAEKVPGMGPQHRLRDPRHGWTSPLCFSETEAWAKHCPNYMADARVTLVEWEWVARWGGGNQDEPQWDGVTGWNIAKSLDDRGASYAQQYEASIHGVHRGQYIACSGPGDTELEARVACMIATLSKLKEAHADGQKGLTCNTCGQPATARVHNGRPAGTHCDTCWQGLVADYEEGQA